VTERPDQPEIVIPRDRWGRPLVQPPGGGKLIPYRRVTNFIDVLDDRWALESWKRRQVAAGMALRPDLILKAAAARGEKAALDEVCDAAAEAAGSSQAATTGTALHAITADIDLGRDVTVPTSVQADVDAYHAATQHLRALMVETFVVHDDLRVGGTFDRVYDVGGGHCVVADLKTGGGLDYIAAKTAMQLALYARGQIYDPRTGNREPLHVDTSRGLIVHLPAGSGECTLHWADLEQGWEDVTLAAQVWSRRARKATLVPYTPPGDTVAALISVAGDRDTLTALWGTYRHVWTPEHTAAAQQRLAQLRHTDHSPAPAA